MNDCLQFDQGIMRLSLFDPLSNQYETRILTLPELPLLESLENLFDNAALSTNTARGALRMTKSCHNSNTSSNNAAAALLKKAIYATNGATSSSNSLISTPRRCQSNPNLTKQQLQQGKKMHFTSNTFSTASNSNNHGNMLLFSIVCYMYRLIQK
jgi:hypothetical protein